MNTACRALAFIALAVLIPGCAAPLHLEYAPGQVTSSPREGMVVAEAPLAAEVGARVLGEGGNAVDAAVATAFAMAATLPQAGGPGGGGFAVVRLPGHEPVALDFREVAPAGATRDMFLTADGQVDRRRSVKTVLAAGVPGTPAGLAELHRRHGSLPWSRLVAPGVRLAAEGFAIDDSLARVLNEHREQFLGNAAARAIFVREDRPWEAGDILRQADLGKTLAEIRDRGAAGFYNGPVAAAVVLEMWTAGGLITAEDLRSYRPVWREPVRFEFRGHEVLTMPLPSSGGVVLPEILTLLDLSGGMDAAPGSVDRLHLFAEAERRAFADRNALLGDPEGVPAGLVEHLRSVDYLAARAATIDPAWATPSSEVTPGGDPTAVESPSTTNLCVVDRNGGAVALTYTLNSTFGSHLVVPGTGILLNNEMDDFAAKPGQPNQFGLRQGERNAIVPGHRMLSSMAPTLVVRDGRAVLAVGSPGGPRILTAVALVIAGVAGDGLPLDLAVLAPRIHHQHLPDHLFREDAAVTWPEGRERLDLEPSNAALGDLAGRGHELRPRDTAIGRITAISIDESGRLIGVADPRGGGRAVAGAGIKVSGVAVRYADADENGAFEVASVPPGTWRVEAFTDDLKSAPVMVEVKGARSPEAVKLEMVRSGRILVVFREPDRLALAEATLRLLGERGEEYPLTRSDTADFDRRSPKLLPGRYEIEIACPYRNPLRITVELEGGETRVEVGAP